jgi:ubiquinone/menaquinone biosynthesis C-methylase UbiE
MRLPRGIRVLAKRLAYGGGASDRERERVVAWLRLQPGMRVADIGAGLGSWAFAFAHEVGPTGVVYAVDTDADLREEVAAKAAGLGLLQVHAIAAAAEAPALPEPVDLAFLSKSFHHLPDRVRYLERLRAQLRSDARVVIIESRPGSGLRVPGHDTAPEEVQATMGAAGYRSVGSADLVSGSSIQAFAPDVSGGGRLG